MIEKKVNMKIMIFRVYFIKECHIRVGNNKVMQCHLSCHLSWVINNNKKKKVIKEYENRSESSIKRYFYLFIYLFFHFS